MNRKIRCKDCNAIEETKECSCYSFNKDNLHSRKCFGKYHGIGDNKCYKCKQQIDCISHSQIGHVQTNVSKVLGEELREVETTTDKTIKSNSTLSESSPLPFIKAEDMDEEEFDKLITQPQYFVEKSVFEKEIKELQEQLDACIDILDEKINILQDVCKFAFKVLSVKDKEKLTKILMKKRD